MGANFASIARAAQENASARRYSALTEDQAATVEAVTGRIIPTTATPGAIEAGAVWFIDAALSQDMAAMKPFIEAGIAELNSAANGAFAVLDPSQQDQLLRNIENGPFFGLLHALTLAGTFTMPHHGGNAGELGWKMLGYDPRGSWLPPFGTYDADAHGDKVAASQAPKEQSVPVKELLS